MNSAGAGAASTSVTVTPATVPGPPTIGTATITDLASRIYDINFTAPIDNGSSAITSYKATGTPTILGHSTAIGTGTRSPISITLGKGITYNITVTATNSIGTSPPSASTTVTTSASGGSKKTRNKRERSAFKKTRKHK